MKYPHTNIAIGKFGKMIEKPYSENADSMIRAALNAGRAMTFATSQPASWKAHFTKRFPDAKIEEVEGGLRISK